MSREEEDKFFIGLSVGFAVGVITFIDPQAELKDLFARGRKLWRFIWAKKRLLALETGKGGKQPRTVI